MTPKAYRDLGRDLHQLFEVDLSRDELTLRVDAENWEDKDDATAWVLVCDLRDEIVDAVRARLVEFFRANDPNFNEGEFVGSTYGA